MIVEHVDDGRMERCHVIGGGLVREHQLNLHGPRVEVPVQLAIGLQLLVRVIEHDHEPIEPSRRTQQSIM